MPAMQEQLQVSYFTPGPSLYLNGPIALWAMLTMFACSNLHWTGWPGAAQHKDVRERPPGTIINIFWVTTFEQATSLK